MKIKVKSLQMPWFSSQWPRHASVTFIPKVPYGWRCYRRLLLLSTLFSAIVTLPALARGPLGTRHSIARSQSAIAQRTAVPPHLAPTATQILQRVNQFRISQGLLPVRTNPKLNQVAQSYSQRMGQTGCFGHNCASGATLKQRIAAVGIATNRVTENLFKSPGNGDISNQAVSGWINDMAHRCNLLLPETTETGIGIWQQGQTVYVTQILAQPRSGPNAVSSSSRATFEAQFKQASPSAAVRRFETLQTREFGQQLLTPLCGIISSPQRTARTLDALSRFTGKRASVSYVVALKDQLQLLTVLPESRRSAHSAPTLVASTGLEPIRRASNRNPPVIRQVLGNVSRDELLAVARAFRQAVSDPSRARSQSYLASAQKLYQWLVAPIEPQLRAQKIDTILFSMDDGLRSIPVAALHDGRQFLVEKYSVTLLPSFGLTQVRFSDLKTRSLLAMGISESTAGQSALPAVSLELSLLQNTLWRGQTQVTLNQNSTLTNLKAIHRQLQPGIIHLATHAEFKSGQIHNSFIQFWNNKLTWGQLLPLSQQLRWGNDPSVQLLVLSACQTAIGSKEAELGFAGSAIAAGVPATMASLWSVSDDGTLGIMTQFYQHLKRTSTKTEALRRAQLSMLAGEFKIHNGQLHLSTKDKIVLPPPLALGGDRTFTHPYFWSGYTIVGNWN